MKTQWMVQEVTPMNFHDNKKLLILTSDRNFCYDCYYLIGVRTGHDTAMYSLLVKSMKSTSEYENLLRVGETKVIKMKAKEDTHVF